MKGQVSLITLGVRDLKRAKAFYTALGWQDTAASQEAVAFLAGHHIVLGLYGRAALAEDAGIADQEGGFSGITLAVNCPDRESVDQLATEAVAAGGRLQKAPQEVFWGGYSGYVADPDGHLWEIAHNPFFPLDGTGKLTLEPLPQDASGDGA
ncbi:MAG: VOC family protein [Hyphomicrobiaceae bacterium]|nr:VOC family protein [Hyphomicrobiaceae bacterium]